MQTSGLLSKVATPMTGHDQELMRNYFQTLALVTVKAELGK